ncbi:hypothetical protein [Actinoalloteichus spitiensis]|nr:hypothetical protein [Actinoalloteichus spitiensis]
MAPLPRWGSGRGEDAHLTGVAARRTRAGSSGLVGIGGWPVGRSSR